jgi:hypothetical protein
MTEARVIPVGRSCADRSREHAGASLRHRHRPWLDLADHQRRAGRRARVAHQTAGPLDRWTAGPLDRWTAGPLDRWTAGPLDRWTGSTRSCVQSRTVMRSPVASRRRSPDTPDNRVSAFAREQGMSLSRRRPVRVHPCRRRSRCGPPSGSSWSSRGGSSRPWAASASGPGSVGCAACRRAPTSIYGRQLFSRGLRPPALVCSRGLG